MASENESINFTPIWNQVLEVSKTSLDLTPRQVKSLEIVSLDSFFGDNLILTVNDQSDLDVLNPIVSSFLVPALSDFLQMQINVFIKVSVGNITNNTIEDKISNSYIPKIIDESNRAHSHNIKLNKDMTFDNFIVGTDNNLAHSLAVQVADGITHKRKNINPLFIFGPPGVGKTHLINAIGNSVHFMHPKLNIIYVGAQTFIDDFSRAVGVQKGTPAKFKTFYSKADLLILDDIQDFSEKEGTQKAFFHIFNDLISSNKQIVITSDTYPDKLVGFHERMISRFKSSAYFGIEEPELETRESFIRKYINREAESLRKDGIIFSEYIILKLAKTLVTNIREIIGALETIIFYCRVNETPLTESVVDSQLASYIIDTRDKITPERVIRICAEYYGISYEDILGPVRLPIFTEARHISMYLCRKVTNMTVSQLATIYSKNHSTISTAETKITKLIKNKKYYTKIEELLTKIKKS